MQQMLDSQVLATTMSAGKRLHKVVGAQQEMLSDVAVSESLALLGGCAHRLQRHPDEMRGHHSRRSHKRAFSERLL
jgi:hypothetical protein